MTYHRKKLLIRFVDDFLLITTKRTIAVQFLRDMFSGFPDYGCAINEPKTMVNFSMLAAELDAGKAATIGRCPDSEFPWCGLLIDTDSLEVAADFSKYFGCCKCLCGLFGGALIGAIKTSMIP